MELTRLISWIVVLGALALGLWWAAHVLRFPRLSRIWWRLPARERRVLRRAGKHLLESELAEQQTRLDLEYANRPPPPPAVGATPHWINSGIRLERPAVVWIPWDTTAAGLRDLLGPHGLVESPGTSPYIRCCLFGGLPAMVYLDCHPLFPRHELMALRVNASFKPGKGRSAAYENAQSLLVATFGLPTSSRPSSEPGYTNHEWDFSHVIVLHEVRERFGPEELIVIGRKSLAQVVSPTMGRSTRL